MLFGVGSVWHLRALTGWTNLQTLWLPEVICVVLPNSSGWQIKPPQVMFPFPDLPSFTPAQPLPYFLKQTSWVKIWQQHRHSGSHWLRIISGQLGRGWQKLLAEAARKSCLASIRLMREVGTSWSPKPQGALIPLPSSFPCRWKNSAEPTEVSITIVCHA